MKKIFLVFFLSINYCLANCSDPSSVANILDCNWSHETLSFGLPPCEECAFTSASYSLGNSTDMPGLTDLFSEQGADCSGFIEEDGSLGPYGDTINEYISNNEVSARFLNDDLPHITDACPGWANLNDDERKHFWVWTFASIAWDESRCQAGARNSRGSNGPAIGLLQLDETYSDRSWRGPNCRVDSVTGATQNLLCGMDIMSELLLGPEGEYRGRGAIFIQGRRNTSYWQKLKTSGGGEIGSRIRSHPLCQN